MSYNLPLVEYKSIKVGGVEVTLGSQCKASFVSPYNEIELKISPTNCSISQYDVRVTKADDEYGLDIGCLAKRATNISINEERIISIICDETSFIHGPGSYRISLYARSALDNSWDVTYLFCTLGDNQNESYNFILADGGSFEVLTTQDVI